MSSVIASPDQQPSLALRLKAVLDGDFAKERDAARAFISQPDMAPVSSEMPKAEYREKTLEWVRKMAAAGFTKLPYDTQYGGAGERLAYLNIVEMIGHQDLSLAVKQGVQFGLFGMGVNSLGTDKHRSAYLPGIMKGEILGGFAMTETGGGSDVQGVRTEAIYDHATRSFTLNTPVAEARKAYIGNAALHGEMMVVFAQLKMEKDAESQGVHAFLMPIRDKQGNILPGVTVEDCGHKIGLNGVDNGYLSFDNVKLPYDALLDRFAQIDETGAYKSDIEKKTKRFFKMISTLVTGRVFVSMISLSGAKNALTAAVDFADSRIVFGDNLLDKQATHSRLFSHLSHAYATHFATRHLLQQFADDTPELETMAAAIKSRSSDAAIKAIDETRLLTGGLGYMSEQRYGALRNDVDIFRTFEGDNTILKLLVAKNQLSRLSQKFNKASGIEKFRKLVGMKLKTKLATFQVKSGSKDTSHLLDPAFQQKLFAHRERIMMYQFSEKVMSLHKKEGAAVAANRTQDDMLAYADAYTDRIMMEQFIQAVGRQTDPQVQEVLKDLCDAYAVHMMRQNALWYAENGLMSTGKTKILARLEQELHEKIRPHAKELTEAFAIPAQIMKCSEPVLKQTKIKDIKP